MAESIDEHVRTTSQTKVFDFDDRNDDFNFDIFDFTGNEMDEDSLSSVQTGSKKMVEASPEQVDKIAESIDKHARIASSTETFDFDDMPELSDEESNAKLAAIGNRTSIASKKSGGIKRR